MKLRKEWVFLTIVGLVITSQIIYSEYKKNEIEIQTFHTYNEKKAFKEKLTKKDGDTSKTSRGAYPIEDGEFFLHSNNCDGCHGNDPIDYANVTEGGVDVNLYDDWRATMMANSAKDPLWRAKVSHEILVNPTHANELQNKCTSCHAPMGNYTSRYKGNPFYTIADLLNDSLGLDGVSCLGCHMIGPDNLGTLFSGEIPYDTNHVVYGPFTGPVLGPMQLYIGMSPVFSTHVSQGGMCASCHTLITETADLSGNPTGNTFVEQATYHEWVNSSYNADNVTCQTCHMPETEDSIRIANGYAGIEKRFPFNQHQFQGGNLFMLKLMKENKERLNIDATDANYDSTIYATEYLLKNATMKMDLIVDSVGNDSAYFSVKLTNKAGHKFPSGYPSRRAVVKFVAIKANGDTLFQSGLFDPNYEVNGIDPLYEPHYNIITNQNQAQIYEMVMGDVNGDRTTVLERADVMLKDNRVPPEGFLTSSNVYDTVQIVGVPTTDVDFNRQGVTEGTGKDFVHYHIPMNGYTQNFNVYAYVYYQVLPPRFLDEMFSFSSAAIDTFRVMFEAADKSPVLVASDSLFNINLGTVIPDYDELISIYPDPTSDGNITISLPSEFENPEIVVYNSLGQRVYQQKNNSSELQIQLPQQKGNYLVEIKHKNKFYTRKVIRN